mmetsp:Transcript_30095/g.70495  ORF Transcript_30095/g.70495 Transcript_30095/m.70495 type:complete len:247 (-) Transcript_30095:236-976(-)
MKGEGRYPYILPAYKLDPCFIKVFRLPSLDVGGSVGMLVVDIDEGSLLVGGALALSALVREEGDEESDSQDGDGNADNGSCRQALGAGINEGLEGALLLGEVAAVDGFLLTELLDHGRLAAGLFNGVLCVVDIGGEVGVDVIDFVVALDADGSNEVLKERFPVVDVRSVGGIGIKVVVESTGLDGELDLEGSEVLVVNIVVVESEILEDVFDVVIGGVVLVGVLNIDILKGNLEANVERKVGEGLA